MVIRNENWFLVDLQYYCLFGHWSVQVSEFFCFKDSVFSDVYTLITSDEDDKVQKLEVLNIFQVLIDS